MITPKRDFIKQDRVCKTEQIRTRKSTDHDETNKPTRPKRPATAVTAAQQRKNRARKLAHKDPDKRENRKHRTTRNLTT